MTKLEPRIAPAFAELPPTLRYGVTSRRGRRMARMSVRMTRLRQGFGAAGEARMPNDE